MLIAYESRIEKHRQQEIASINLSESAKSNDTPTQSQINVTQQSSTPLNNYNRGGRYSSHGGRCSGRGGHGRYSGFQCQVCHRYGHIALNYFYHFQEDY